MEQKQGPDTPSLAHERQEAAVTMCRDAFGGPLAVRARGKKYLPKFPRETDNEYNDRLSTSVYYDAFSRTIMGLTGMVFRKPPKLADELPSRIRDLWENIDLHGTHGDVFCQHRHRDGEVDGHFVIMVDMQPADPNAKTLADERQRRLRPYWVGIKKQDVIAADYENRGGQPTLVHFRYRETVTVKDGQYGQREAKRVREYNLAGESVEYILWEKQKVESTSEERYVQIGGGSMSIDEIPVAVGYHGDKLGHFESRPPHLSLALESFKHYQLVSDNDNVLHLCSVPQLMVKDWKGDDDAAIGPNVAWDMGPDGDLKYAEPMGNGLEAAERRINKSEQRMATLGLSMLMSESRSAETATSKRIDKAESDSALSDHARASQDAFEDAIRLTAKWLGETELPTRDKDARWVSLNRDFEGLHLDAQMVGVLANIVAQGDLSQETLWETLQRASILPDSFSDEEERDRIDSGGMEAIRQMVAQVQPRPAAEPKAAEADA